MNVIQWLPNQNQKAANLNWETGSYFQHVQNTKDSILFCEHVLHLEKKKSEALTEKAAINA